VRLAEPLGPKGKLPLVEYAQIFRVIGQSLADLRPSRLTITLSDRLYTVTFECERRRIEAEASNPVKSQLKSFVEKYLPTAASALDLRPEAAPPPLVELIQTYAPSDIQHLEEQGQKYRTGMARIPDARSLSEALRTVGRLLDACHGTFLSLVRDHESVMVEYIDPDGQRQSRSLTHYDLYKLQQRFYKNRGQFEPQDLWVGSR
jgi:hypothetical protein